MRSGQRFPRRFLHRARCFNVLNELFERAFMDCLRRLPGAVVAAVALIFYPVVGLLLPLVLHSSVLGFVEANVIGTVFFAAVTLGWLLVQIESRDRRHLIEWTTDLRLLDAAEFEWLVGETFRREQWKVVETGRRDGPDGNIDLELARSGVRKIVQCKRWEARDVGVDHIRAFAGTLMRESLSGEAGIFVTLSDFTEQARQEARAVGITLIDGTELVRRVHRARRAERCPICTRPMLLDRSYRGWWLRCATAGCMGKRDLSNEPARAVELLTLAA